MLNYPLGLLGLMVSLLVISGGRGADPRQAPTPPRRFDLQGDALPEGAVARLGTVRFRHGNFIHDLAYSPDGKLLVSTSTDALRVWEVASGKERFTAIPAGTSWI